MIFRPLASFAFILAVAKCDAADPVPPWTARTPDGGAVRVAVAAPENPRFAHLAWPKALRAKDGTIILAYLAGIFHGRDGGSSPAVSLSTDNGRTFTAPKILHEFSPGEEYTDSGNLAIGLADDGAVVFLSMGYRGDEANNIYGWRSEDNGRSWNPVDASALGPNKTGSVVGNIVSVPGVGLMVMGHYRKGAKPHDTGIWRSTSEDGGRTWAEPKMVTDVNAGEPVLIRAGSRLLVFIRGRDQNAIRQYIAVSDDNGATWHTELSTLVAERPSATGLTHPFAMVNPQKPTEILAVTTERPLPGRTWLWRGDPQKLSWKRDRVLLDFPLVQGDDHSDFGYTWLLPTDAGHALMFYYHGLRRGANSIWVTDVML